MSVLEPETQPRDAVFWDVADINREFLALLTDPDLDPAGGGLGLEPGVLAALRGLSPEGLDRLAACPVVLAEFRPLPGRSGAGRLEVHSPTLQELPADGSRSIAALGSPEWRTRLRSFADRLLTCMWQASKQPGYFASFCMGLDARSAERLSALSFGHTSRYSATAWVTLRARLGEHPTCWHDLIRSMRARDHSRQHAAQLSLIPLTIAERVSLRANPNRRLFR